LYLINTYEKNRELVSYAGAAPTKNIFAANTDELTSLLPSYVFAPDLTMTMAGWTFTTPFSHSRFTGRAVDMSLVGLIFSTIASIMTTINLIAT
jgi:heme/copper-type cytochrome/quinol oxidase subunit 1